MDPKEFQAREADKLAAWVTQTLAIKDAKVQANDAIAAIGQRVQVDIQTSTLEDTPTPPIPLSESTSGRNNGGGGLTEERVREIVKEMLEDYATKEWVTEQLEPYATTEWVEEQNYATEEWVIDQNYATEEWVQEQLQPYATQDWVNDRLVGFATEAWVNEQLGGYVKEEFLITIWWGRMFAENAWVDLIGNVIQSDQFDRNIKSALNSLSVAAECGEGTVTVTLDNNWSGGTV
jgi:hypothetical protein